MEVGGFGTGRDLDVSETRQDSRQRIGNEAHGVKGGWIEIDEVIK